MLLTLKDECVSIIADYIIVVSIETVVIVYLSLTNMYIKLVLSAHFFHPYLCWRQPKWRLI